MAHEWAKFDTRAALDVALAEQVSARLACAITARGSATLVVSGGKTPIHFFEQLSRIAISWRDVRVLLADERWLEPDHKDSNEKLVREHLLQNAAAAARFQPFKTAAQSAALGQPECEAWLAQSPTFDVVILGMGDDAHTASLFPGSAALAEGLALTTATQCLAVQPLTAPYERISMTLVRLLNSRMLCLHICGDEKKQLVHQALNCPDPLQMPIAAVLRQSQTPLNIYWAP